MQLEASFYWENKLGDKARGLPSTTLIPRSEFKGAKDLENWLQFQGFGLGQGDHWCVLGLTRKACKGQEQVIEGRLQQAIRIIDLAAELDADGSIGNCKSVLTKTLVEASIKCKEDLLKPTPKDPTTPAWATEFGELGEEALHLIRNIIGPDATLCTQLSSLTVLPQALSNTPLGTEAIQSIDEHLGSGHKTATVNSAGIALWAPNNREVGALAANYCKGGTAATINWLLHFIYPLDIIFNGLTEEATRDIWKCPLFKSQWSTVLSRVSILQKPTKIVPPCLAAPQVQWRQLAIITLSPNGTKIPPPLAGHREVRWREWQEQGIYIDAPVEDLVMVRRAAATILGGAPFAFAPQVRSPAHTKESPRSRVQICLPHGTFNAFDLKGVITLLQHEMGRKPIIIADSNLFKDPHALLGELTDPWAIHEVSHLCRDVAYVDNKTVTLRTDASPETWVEALRQQFFKSPHAVITSIKPKPSRGGRPWATCPTTKPHAIASAKEQKRKSDECMATLNIHGPYAYGIPAILRRLVSQLPITKSPVGSLRQLQARGRIMGH